MQDTFDGHLPATLKSRAEQKPRLLLMGLKRFVMICHAHWTPCSCFKERENIDFKRGLPENDPI